MNNSNRGQSRNQGRNYQSYNSNDRSMSTSRRDNQYQGSQNQGTQRDWYDRDPMDEASGYRDENESRRHGSQSQSNYGSSSSYGSANRNNGDYGYSQSSRPSDRLNRESSREGKEFDTFGSRSSSAGDFYRPSDSEDQETSYSRPQSQGQSNYRNPGSADYSRSFRGGNEGSDYDQQYNRSARQNYQGGYQGGMAGGMTQGQGAYGTSNREQGQSPYANSSYRASQNYGASRDSSQGSWGAGDSGSQANDSRMNRSSSSSFSAGSSYGQDFGSRQETRGQYSGRGPKGFKRSDERIKEEVCELLTRHHDIDADDIDVEVKEGEVTLTGTVSNRRMKHLAEDAVEQCYGVKDVTNNIRVKRDEATDSSSDRSESSRQGSSAKDSASTSGKKSATGSTAADAKNSTTTPIPNH